MSRIGKLPITSPRGRDRDGRRGQPVTVKGPKGALSQKVNKDINVNQEGRDPDVTRPTDDKPHQGPCTACTAR